MTLELIYDEILSLQRKVDFLLELLTPWEELDEAELEEIKTLRAESLVDRGIPWEQVRAKLDACRLNKE